LISRKGGSLFREKPGSLFKEKLHRHRHNRNDRLRQARIAGLSRTQHCRVRHEGGRYILSATNSRSRSREEWKESSPCLGRPESKTLAGGGGFEPPLTGPEPVVLPLDDPPEYVKRSHYTTRVVAGTWNGRIPRSEAHPLGRSITSRRVLYRAVTWVWRRAAPPIPLSLWRSPSAAGYGPSPIPQSTRTSPDPRSCS
jgi:hypothetical protein